MMLHSGKLHPYYKQYSKLERPAKDLHSSLFDQLVRCKQKRKFSFLMFNITCVRKELLSRI